MNDSAQQETKDDHPDTPSLLRHALAVVLSHAQAGLLLVRTVWMRRRPGGLPYGRTERRRVSRACVLCPGPMKREGRRPPTDERDEDGEIVQVPEGVLEWYRCVRCEQSLTGVPPGKVANGQRWAA